MLEIALEVAKDHQILLLLILKNSFHALPHRVLTLNHFKLRSARTVGRCLLDRHSAKQHRTQRRTTQSVNELDILISLPLHRKPHHESPFGKRRPLLIPGSILW
jgi:hypothetical protein